MLELCGCEEVIGVGDSTDIALVRRRAVALAVEAGLEALRCDEIALVASELASNVWKHAGSGGVVLGVVRRGEARGIALVAWDRGPGMDIARCSVDGVSNAGTTGTGLGCIARLSSSWDGFSMPGRGSVIGALAFADKREHEGTFRCGALSVPYPGERVCGDAYRCIWNDGVATMLVVDGLGHGALAAEAAHALCESFERNPSASPAAILQQAHLDVRHTRGAAAAIARLEPSASKVTFAGVGNVAGWLWDGVTQRSMVAHHGTLGHALTRAREEVYPLAPGTNVILASDGLKTQLAFRDYPQLAQCAPSTIAGVLWRDHSRGRDDATVAVVRAEAAS